MCEIVAESSDSTVPSGAAAPRRSPGGSGGGSRRWGGGGGAGRGRVLRVERGGRARERGGKERGGGSDLHAYGEEWVNKWRREYASGAGGTPDFLPRIAWRAHPYAPTPRPDSTAIIPTAYAQTP